MKLELKKLLISEKEFQEITGISIEEINEITIYQEKIALHKFRKTTINFLSYFAAFLIGISLILALIIWLLSQIIEFVTKRELYDFNFILRLSAYLSLPVSLFISIKLNYRKLAKLNTKKKYFKHLTVLFNEYKKHNQIVRAIDVKEQLEAVEEQTGSESQVKSTLSKALVEMREDLIKALKIEKILRENRTVVETNPELFKSSFDATNVQKIIDRGSEYDRLINKALKIGSKLNKEMKLMQNDNNGERQ